MLNVAIKIGISLAMAAGSMAITASQHFEGQRLSDLNVNLADYGAPLPRFWGVSRFDGCPMPWAEQLKEKKTTHKTKGGKYTEYKYFGTWASIVADHQIDAVRGIWLDRHLCYQARDAGPLTPVLGDETTISNGNVDSPPVKLMVGSNLRIYLGTEDQDPDPRYEAWCEDRYGADSAPAFKGVAYVVFQDIPLEKFGNRLPQVSIEGLRTKSPGYPFDLRTGNTGRPSAFSPDYSRLYTVAGTAFQVWDVATRTILTSRSLASGIDDRLGVTSGAVYGWMGPFFDPQMIIFEPDGGGASVVTFVKNEFTPYDMGEEGAYGGLSCKGGTLLAYPLNTNEEYIGVVGTNTISKVAVGFAPTHYFADADGGEPWAVGCRIGDVNLGIAQLFGASVIDVSHDGGAVGMDNGAGQLLVLQGGFLQLWDKATLTKVTETPLSIAFSIAFVDFDNVPAGSPFIWVGGNKYDTRTLELLETINPNTWTAHGFGLPVYDPRNNALVSIESGTDFLIWRYLDRISNTGVLLSTIAAEVLELANVQRFDVSALDQVVKGYAVTPGTGRAILDPLLTLHYSAARPHGFTLEFIKLGAAASGATIETTDFAVLGSDSRFTGRITPDKDLPRSVTVNFADSAKDYQTNNVIAQRGLDEVASRDTKQIDMTTYVGTPDEIRPLAERVFRQQWLERETNSNALTPHEFTLEPGDVRSIALDGKVRTVRANKTTFTGGGLRVDWTRTHASLAALSTTPGAPMDGRDPDTIYVSGPTKGFVLDMPLATDADDIGSSPQLYFGAGKYLASAAWPGGSLFKGDSSDGSYVPWNDVSSAHGATWGYANGALGTVPSPWLWDRLNSLNVAIRTGTLSSVTEDEINADPTLNLAALRNPSTGAVELVNFANAVLESDGSYTLSHFKRGRRGTEAAVASHSSGDEFVLVASLARSTLGLSELGLTEYFKAATLGQDYGGAAALSFGFTGASLKPYAPARISARFDGTDWTFTVYRRTRVGGRWGTGSTIPLSENSEAYEVDVLDGTGAVVRTLTLTGTNVGTYTGAEQIADFGAVQTVRPDLKVYQMSDAVGRGFALAA